MIMMIDDDDDNYDFIKTFCIDTYNVHMVVEEEDDAGSDLILSFLKTISQLYCIYIMIHHHIIIHHFLFHKDEVCFCT